MSETTLGALASSGVLSLGDGYRTKKSELSTEGFRIIRVADVKDGRIALDSPDFVSLAHEKQIGAKRATPGDVLLTTKGTVGRVSVVPHSVKQAVYSPQLCWFRVVRKDVLSPHFLSYWLRSEAFVRQSSYLQGNTDMAPYISLSDLRSAVITLPPIDEQRAIAEVLGALDRKIAANSRVIDLLLKTVNAEFTRWFGDRNLEVRLDSLADVVDCLHSRKPTSTPEGSTLMQLSNIRDDGLVDRGPKYAISAEDYTRWSSKFETRRWDLVITNVGRVGAVARIPKGYVAALGRNMTGIRPKDPRESGSFLVAALLSNAVRREIEQRTDAGSIMNALNVRSIPLLRMPASSPEERTTFHQVASPMLELADRYLSESAALAVARDDLLPHLMSGRLRVRDAAAATSAAARARLPKAAS